MKIAVFTDLRFVRSDTPTGVGKHIIQMVGGLSRIPGNEVTTLVARDQYVEQELRLPGAPYPLTAQKLPLPWKAAEALWTLVGGPATDIYCRDVDWVYCPKNDFIPLANKPLAVTIHGAHELDPRLPLRPGALARLNWLRRRASYWRITTKATLILTVSEFLKRQILEWFRCDESRVVVVGNGVEQVYFDTAHDQRGHSQRSQDRPYLMCIGGLNDLDGGALVLQVADLLQRRHPDLKIIVAGRQHEPRHLSLAKELPNVELLGYVPAKRLAPLMRDALALLYVPSYETFGIAAAEAMAAGTPVITSGGTAIPEIVGDAGLYVSANANDVVEGIGRLRGDEALQESLAMAGRRRAQHFSWQACVNRLDAALRRF